VRPESKEGTIHHEVQRSVNPRHHRLRHESAQHLGHRLYGSGLSASPCIEMADRKLLFERERKMPIHYGGQAIGSRRVDFLVDRRVLVEIKAVHLLDDIHLAQALNHLKVFDLRVGLLLNFGGMRLEFKRLFRKD
jgi:GxxExxY protein